MYIYVRFAVTTLLRYLLRSPGRMAGGAECHYAMPEAGNVGRAAAPYPSSTVRIGLVTAASCRSSIVSYRDDTLRVELLLLNFHHGNAHSIVSYVSYYFH